MQATTKLSMLCLAFTLLTLGASAQNTYIPNGPGYVNFNLGNTTLPHSDSARQPVTLYGCNTIISVPGKLPGGERGFLWNTGNQVLSGIPFGPQFDTLKKDSFYISKYYIASPPVFKKVPHALSDSNTVYDIGLVEPDEFTLEGEKPGQTVNMNYNLLQPPYVKYLPVKFDSSFIGSGVDVIPINVECKDFPWRNSGAPGASGIGGIKRDSLQMGQLFLPYYYVPDTSTAQATDSVQRCLDCRVTILNDILFKYEVSFRVKGIPAGSSIELKGLHDPKKNPDISFHYKPVDKLLCGCAEPKKK